MHKQYMYAHYKKKTFHSEISFYFRRTRYSFLFSFVKSKGLAQLYTSF